MTGARKLDGGHISDCLVSGNVIQSCVCVCVGGGGGRERENARENEREMAERERGMTRITVGTSASRADVSVAGECQWR